MKLAFLFLILGLLGDAQAQVRLPGLPSVPSLPLPTVPQAVPRDLPALADPLRTRAGRIERLLQSRRAYVETDPAGQPAVRGELVLASPTEALLGAARGLGFTVVRERRLDEFDMTLVTLQAPAGVDTARALQQLRALDPQAAIDFNHVYVDSGATAGAPSAPPGEAPSARSAAPGVRIGLVDSGVATTHPLLRDADITAWGCGGRSRPHAHGTAVASLLVGRRGAFRGAAPDARLYAADVYCDDPQRGGSVEAVAAALAWLLSERVGVANVSLVGPPNRTLEQVVRRVSERGLRLVAAVGNDGPAAPPLYPAAYPGVIAVTAVDARGRVLAEAGRGPHVAFAAPGADLAVAGLGAEPHAVARGTSFAAPLVAALLARGDTPDHLARRARDLGAPGRDPVYGHGLVGEDLRIDPSRVGVR